MIDQLVQMLTIGIVALLTFVGVVAVLGLIGWYYGRAPQEAEETTYPEGQETESEGATNGRVAEGMERVRTWSRSAYTWLSDFFREETQEVAARKAAKLRQIATVSGVATFVILLFTLLLKGWLFRSRLELLFWLSAAAVVWYLVYRSIVHPSALRRVVVPALALMAIAMLAGSRPSFLHAPRTQSVAAAGQGIPNRIFHCKLNPTQKDEPFLWNHNQIALEPGHAYVLWVDGAIDLDPTDGVRQGLEAKFGAVFADPAIMQVSPESARMSPALVKKTWPSNWPMPNEPVGIPIAKVGDGLRFRLYSGEHPVKFTVPERTWDTKLTISTNLPRPDYLRGDLDNHAVFVDGTHGFYTVFLREVAN